ncbi:MAG: peptidoglycan-binding protein [Desmonostoc vinosum HA7617-LM4]|jgi:murein L,D-transpeptidase YcbB/YkuD|nr:peptidoglycan-binding protein [Desmonostoc vinosum HA7617-LM4]
MTEFGLLMTGMLNTKQPSLPNLPEQQPFQMEGVQQSIQSQLPESVLAAQVTPPEFMLTDTTSQPQPSALKLKKENTPKKVRKNNQSLGSSGLADSIKYAQAIGKSRAKSVGRLQKLNRQSLPTLHFGSSGVAVRVLQRLLISNGYIIRVDGDFGPLTETAVKAFQNQQNLSADGVVGQRTWQALTS